MYHLRRKPQIIPETFRPIAKPYRKQVFNVKTFNENIRYKTFGEFLSAKRREREIPSMRVTDALGISPGYFSDIEKGRRNPPDKRTLAKIIDILNLYGDDVDTFYDLAGKARSEAPPDLPEYINTNEVVRVALRLAKDKGNDADWWRFIYSLEDRCLVGG
jgi:transcriptional regulator with XRE-family HTH domain